MSNTTLQTCNVCSAVNTTNDPDWVRFFNIGKGNAPQPLRTFPPVIVDLCPTCAGKTTAAQIPDLFLKKS
ncbi:MAG: hypothetical protein KGL39_19610 [Patescibacteria group bacterium]|nr:hypothetical protein [Patescibacteria group bacterium]